LLADTFWTRPRFLGDTYGSSASGFTSPSLAAPPARRAIVLVELSVVEQRYRAVVEVLSGATVTEVAPLRGGRQTAYDWLRRYAADERRGVNGVVVVEQSLTGG
jgi:hypothetical protein